MEDALLNVHTPCLLCGVHLGPEDRPLVLLDAYPYRRLLKWGAWVRDRDSIRPPGCTSKGSSFRWGGVLVKCHSGSCVVCGPGSQACLISPGCWQVARKTASMTSLVHLARRMYPLFPSKYSSEHLDDHEELCGLENKMNVKTALGHLIKELAARMPVELQAQIMMHLGDCYAVSLIRALRASLPLTGEEDMRSPSRELRVSPGPVKSLSVVTSSLLGRGYLRDIEFDADGAVCVRVEGRGIRGIRFAIDTHGLRGIRVLYVDGGESPWLGDDRGCWYGEAHGTNLERLWVTRDGFRIIRTEFDSPTPLEKDQRPAFWSHEAPLRDGLVNTVLHDASDDNLVQFYPGWRFCEYFSLAAERSHASGIAVSWECESSRAIDICGVPKPRGEAGPRRRDVSYLPNAIHLPLQEGERIVEVWARSTYIPITSTIYQTCHKCLVVTTNLGRSHLFGPHLRAYPVQGNDIYEVYWTPLASVPKGIAGLFLDSRGDIGATHSGPPGRPADVAPPALPQSDAEPECILSTASLCGVRRVSAQMGDYEEGGQALSGMLLEYWDGSASALGRWDPRGGVLEGVVRVFDADEGASLGGLAFRNPEPGQVERVVGVVAFARGDGVPVDIGWVVYDAEKDKAIEWRWIESRPGDIVCRWGGRVEASAPGSERVSSVI